jgi:hypothetical protein
LFDEIHWLQENGKFLCSFGTAHGKTTNPTLQAAVCEEQPLQNFITVFGSMF